MPTPLPYLSPYRSPYCIQRLPSHLPPPQSARSITRASVAPAAPGRGTSSSRRTSTVCAERARLSTRTERARLSARARRHRVQRANKPALAPAAPRARARGLLGGLHARRADSSGPTALHCRRPPRCCPGHPASREPRGAAVSCRRRTGRAAWPDALALAGPPQHSHAPQGTPTPRRPPPAPRGPAAGSGGGKRGMGARGHVPGHVPGRAPHLPRGRHVQLDRMQLHLRAQLGVVPVHAVEDLPTDPTPSGHASPPLQRLQRLPDAGRGGAAPECRHPRRRARPTRADSAPEPATGIRAALSGGDGGGGGGVACVVDNGLVREHAPRLSKLSLCRPQSHRGKSRGGGTTCWRLRNTPSEYLHGRAPPPRESERPRPRPRPSGGCSAKRPVTACAASRKRIPGAFAVSTTHRVSRTKHSVSRTKHNA